MWNKYAQKHNINRPITIDTLEETATMMNEMLNIIQLDEGEDELLLLLRGIVKGVAEGDTVCNNAGWADG